MVYDLLYMGDRKSYLRLQAAMRKKWPEAKFTDASDSIHSHRFSFELEIDEDEYLLAALTNGFFDCSITWKSLELGNPAKALVMMRAVVQYKEGDHA